MSRLGVLPRIEERGNCHSKKVRNGANLAPPPQPKRTYVKTTVSRVGKWSRWGERDRCRRLEDGTNSNVVSAGFARNRTAKEIQRGKKNIKICP